MSNDNKPKNIQRNKGKEFDEFLSKLGVQNVYSYTADIADLNFFAGTMGEESLKVRNSMDRLTRPELDAKLELIETRMDARVDKIATAIKEIKDDNKEIKDDLKNTRITIVTGAISACLTVLFGVIGANYAMIQNMQSSFESGKNISSVHSELKHQNDSIRDELANIRKDFFELKRHLNKKL